MKRFFLLSLAAQLLVSCATKTPGTDLLAQDHPGLPTAAQIKTVPFIQQETNHCGPASLAMALQFTGHPGNLQQITEQLYTPGSKGSFPTDLLSTVRRQGMLGVELHDLRALLLEISGGHPVVVFQNLGFTWLPNWHYAVALGYDLAGPDLILHSGKEKFLRMDLRLFERSWSQAKYWALVVLTPGTLAASVDDLGHVEGTAGLELAGKFNEAQISYEAILKKWPRSLGALVGVGNVLYQKKEFKASAEMLRKASELYPTSAMVFHNLATAQGAAGDLTAAKASAQKALSLASPTELAPYQESLKDFL